MLQHNESKSLEHPAYEEEAAKLADVLRYIEERHLDLTGQMPATAADQRTADAIQKVLQQNADSLYSAFDQPYFGRIDYFRKDRGESGDEPTHTDTPLMSIYLGIAAIGERDIFSWTAPVAKLWYTQSYEDGYTAPRGYIPTRVDLKRYIRIRSRRLEDLNDIFQRQLPAATADEQDVLRRALSGVGRDDGHLQVIVETIEPDQYENIANVSDKVLIVQGAAGSGKSEIGLHRIAYLLSPHSDIAERERPTPDTTLFVGPSQAFLKYAEDMLKDILPTLGVQGNIDQIKFSDWITGRLSARTSVNPRIWRHLRSPQARGEMRLFDERAETFKGSLAMADVIERRVADLANQVRRRCEELPTTIPGIDSLRMTKDQIKSAVNKSLPTSERGRRMNRRRADFINQVMLLIRAAGGSRRPTGPDALRLQRNAVDAWCGKRWEHIDFRDEYVDLLSDPERMMRLSRSDMEREAADGLAKSANGMQSRGFDDSDLGALAYFDHLLNDTIESKYRHIVVDEASGYFADRVQAARSQFYEQLVYGVGRHRAEAHALPRGQRVEGVGACVWTVGNRCATCPHVISIEQAHNRVQQQNPENVRQEYRSAQAVRSRRAPSRAQPAQEQERDVSRGHRQHPADTVSGWDGECGHRDPGERPGELESVPGFLRAREYRGDSARWTGALQQVTNHPCANP